MSKGQIIVQLVFNWMSKLDFATRSHAILTALKTHYPVLSTFLTHQNAFELLIAVILSAQCTDERVNLTTPALFEAYPTPQALATADLMAVMQLLRSVNYYKTKAANIIKTSQMIVTEHAGSVPSTLQELVQFPGVGRKTANVVLGQAFGIPGITVDTHIKRVTRRLGFSTAADPQKIEQELQGRWPQDTWIDLSTYLIYHGRQYCKPRKPLCETCFLLPLCDQKELA